MLITLFTKRIGLAVFCGMVITTAIYFGWFSGPRISYDCLQKDEPYERLRCLRPYFEQLTIDVSAVKALEKTQALMKDGTISDCHLASHYIGEANLMRNGGNAGLAFATCPTGCIEGCYHGVMEAYIAEHGVMAIKDSAPVLCLRIAENKLLYRQCIHGIGHGILRHDADMFLSAIAICQSFKNDWEAETCLGGVFMQRMNEYLLLPESELRTSLPDVCRLLDTLEEPMLVTRCVEGVGGGLMFYTGHDLTRSKTLCLELDEQHHAACIDAVLQEAEVRRQSIQK